MSGLYLSLNQGWTQYKKYFGIKKSRNKIKDNAEFLQSLLEANLV